MLLIHCQGRIKHLPHATIRQFNDSMFAVPSGTTITSEVGEGVITMLQVSDDFPVLSIPEPIANELASLDDLKEALIKARFLAKLIKYQLRNPDIIAVLVEAVGQERVEGRTFNFSKHTLSSMLSAFSKYIADKNYCFVANYVRKNEALYMDREQVEELLTEMEIRDIDKYLGDKAAEASAEVNAVKQSAVDKKEAKVFSEVDMEHLRDTVAKMLDNVTEKSIAVSDCPDMVVSFLPNGKLVRNNSIFHMPDWTVLATKDEQKEEPNTACPYNLPIIDYSLVPMYQEGEVVSVDGKLHRVGNALTDTGLTHAELKEAKMAVEKALGKCTNVKLKGVSYQELIEEFATDKELLREFHYAKGNVVFTKIRAKTCSDGIETSYSTNEDIE